MNKQLTFCKQTTDKIKFMWNWLPLITQPLYRDARPVDAGGGSGSGQQDDSRKTKTLKRKSSEVIIPSAVGHQNKKPKKFYKKRVKSKHTKQTKNGSDQGGSLTSKRMSRRRRRATGTNNAPFNSTQFLMNDHVSEAVKHLNSTLNVKAKPIEAVDESSIDSSLLEQRPVRRITRYINNQLTFCKQIADI